MVLKIAPDLDVPQLIEMAEVIRDSKIDGVIISNTTIQRPKELINGEHYSFCRYQKANLKNLANKFEQGGLSGPPIKHFSLKALQTLRSHLPASIPLIGCGGINTGQDALDYAKAGASVVQVYTGFAYDGPGACRRIKDQLAELLVKEGKTWEGVVRDAVDRLSWKGDCGKKEDSEITVSKLIEEAKELNVVLDKLAQCL